MRAGERQLVPAGGATGGPPVVVRATVRRAAGLLAYRLVVTGVDVLALPRDPDGPGRRDGLWRRTCAELFVGVSGRPDYLEWNLSPSGHWNLYRFDGYREGGRPEPAVADAAPRVARGDGELVIEARLPLEPLGLSEQPLEAGISAVVEAADGTLTYWALVHPGERPDFHDRRGFILRLDPESPAPADPGGNRG